jgi:hypothetical protein
LLSALGFRRMVRSTENLRLEQSSKYEDRDEDDGEWRKYWTSPPVRIKEVSLPKGSEAQSNRAQAKKDRDCAEQVTSWLQMLHFRDRF